MALAIAFTGNGPGFAQQAVGQGASATSVSPQSTFSIAAAKTGRTGKVSVIVELEDASLASYSGGVQGLAATNPRVSGARRLNVASLESRAYLGHLAQ